MKTILHAHKQHLWPVVPSLADKLGTVSMVLMALQKPQKMYCVATGQNIIRSENSTIALQKFDQLTKT
jgi:hypothetical protein